MDYEEFVAYVWDMITRNKAYELQDAAKGDPATDYLQVRTVDACSERSAMLHLGAMYTSFGGENRGRVRVNVRRLLPWDGKVSTGLTCDECRQILGAERQPMFESLRLLRAAYARRENVAPYIIFSNHALLAMCQQGPETLEGLRELPGVGKVNSARYGDGFLELIRYHNQRIRKANSVESLPQDTEE